MDMQDAERATDLMQEIGGIIVNDKTYAGKSWQALAIVVRIEPSMQSKNGFYWDETGKAQPDYPRDPQFLDKIEELQAVTRGPDGRAWVSALIRMKRDTMAMTIEYEYDDPARWKVTPFNVDERREELRPK